MDTTVTCPYCNEPVPQEDWKEPGFITNCCSRVVVFSIWTEMQPVLHRPSGMRAKELVAAGIVGDTSSVKKQPSNYRPDSKFTAVYTTGPHHVVRLVPKFMDLEEQGRPHGLGLAQTFTSEHEAHRFADSVDAFLLAMIKDYKETEE